MSSRASFKVANAGLFLSFGLPEGFGAFGEKTDITSSQSSMQGTPSNLRFASNDMISASLEECDIAPCFLHIQVIGQNVCLPIKQRMPPEVDFESRRSPAKLASQNSANTQSSGLSPM